MKHLDHFSKFLTDTVNLNQTRIDTLDSSITAIETFLKKSDYGAKIKRFAGQGSWAHGTIIKPLEGRAFDADLIMIVDEVPDWEAKDYINDLTRIFRSSETYKGKTRSFSHCVTIEYAGERRIDIAPCVANRQGVEGYHVCNRNDNKFELTDAEAYTKWVNQRNVWARGNSLKKSVRLIKYLRDIKTTFTCPSVLLTTLIGERINALDQYSSDFCDTPTALKSLIGRLDDWLQQQEYTPIIPNPVLENIENFASAWDQTKFENFRDQIHRYRTWIEDAYNEEDKNESIAKWRRVFSDNFAKGTELKEASSTFEKSSAVLLREGAIISAAVKDIVDLIVHFGAKAIPRQLSRLPYLSQPTWPVNKNSSITVRVRAKLCESKMHPAIRDVDLAPMPKGYWIKFEATNSTGIPFGKDFTVKWRVANTGDDAIRANCLRGGFVASHSQGVLWEELKFRGVHFVEAFLIRSRDGAQVGKSDPFYVVVE